MRGDKIIVFSDNIFALREYAQRLRRPFIFGGTSHAERTRVLAAFKRNPEVSHAPPEAFAFVAHYGTHSEQQGILVLPNVCCSHRTAGIVEVPGQAVMSSRLLDASTHVAKDAIDAL